MNALKSKTIWFSMILAVCGVLEQSQGALTGLIGASNTGFLLLIVSMVTAYLRTLTTQSLSDK
jgi:hypothetical protein